MPSLIRYRTGVFYIVYCVKGKRIWRSLRTRDRVEAYRRFADRHSINPIDSPPNVQDAENEFLSFVRTNLSKKTLECYERTFRNLRTVLGKKRFEDLSTRDVESYKSNRAGNVSPFTVNQELRCLRAFYNRLLTWSILTKNPCAGVREVSVPETIPVHLSQTDLRKLLEYTKTDALHDVILFASMTGLRRGEICNLMWKDVDLHRGTILVRSSQSFRTKGGKIRLVPMNTTVRGILEKQSRVSDYVFAGGRGGRINGNFLRARFKKITIACGLDARLHFHSLRHTFASLLVKDGVSLYHVQRLLGHSSPRVTQVYAHLGPAELIDTVEKLSSLAGPNSSK